MIYFPDITGRGGWADTLLGILVRPLLLVTCGSCFVSDLYSRHQGYNSNPARLHALIRTAFLQVVAHSSFSAAAAMPILMLLQATSEIQLDGTVVIPTPLFEVLDGQVRERRVVALALIRFSDFG
jgi:hypothetical protein